MSLLAEALRALRPGAGFALVYNGAPTDLENVRIEWADPSTVPPTPAEILAKLTALRAARVPTAHVRPRRRAYLAAGATPAALVYALWEAVIEKRPAAAHRLQELRVAVKRLHPSLVDVAEKASTPASAATAAVDPTRARDSEEGEP